jgi:hypothetical protein
MLRLPRMLASSMLRLKFVSWQDMEQYMDPTWLSDTLILINLIKKNQHESVSFPQALLHATEKSNAIAALLPGPWNAPIAAKQIVSIDHYTNGRIFVNVVSGWLKAEFTNIGH